MWTMWWAIGTAWRCAKSAPSDHAESSTPPSISTLNLTDGTLTVVAPLEDTLNISGMASDPANDTLYYYSNNTVWAMQGLGDAKNGRLWQDALCERYAVPAGRLYGPARRRRRH